MYKLTRVYTEIKERYIEGIGWVSSKPEKGQKVTMYAVSYVDIDSDGVVHYKGVEDFSVERFKKLHFAVVELKNKVEKEKPTYKTAYKHIVVKRVYFRYSSDKKTTGANFKKYLDNKYKDALQFNEITARYY